MDSIKISKTDKKQILNLKKQLNLNYSYQALSVAINVAMREYEKCEKENKRRDELGREKEKEMEMKEEILEKILDEINAEFGPLESGVDIEYYIKKVKYVSVSEYIGIWFYEDRVIINPLPALADGWGGSDASQ